MSRTKLGYFKEPLTQVERDLIWVPFEEQRNKRLQRDIFLCFDQVTRQALNYFGNEVVLIDALVDAYLEDRLHETSLLLERAYLTREFYNRELYWIKCEGGTLIRSQAIMEMEDGKRTFKNHPYQSRVTDANLVSFANDNIELFKTAEEEKGYEINKFIAEYLASYHNAAEIGRGFTEDHSDFLDMLLKMVAQPNGQSMMDIIEKAKLITDPDQVLSKGICGLNK